MLYFHPRLQTEDDVRDLQSSLSREPRSDRVLVVTAQGSFALEGVSVVRLDDLVEVDLETGNLLGIAAQQRPNQPRSNARVDNG